MLWTVCENTPSIEKLIIHKSSGTGDNLESIHTNVMNMQTKSCFGRYIILPSCKRQRDYLYFKRSFVSSNWLWAHSKQYVNMFRTQAYFCCVQARKKGAGRSSGWKHTTTF